jgi:hypothetical protein
MRTAGHRDADGFGVFESCCLEEMRRGEDTKKLTKDG